LLALTGDLVLRALLFGCAVVAIINEAAWLVAAALGLLLLAPVFMPADLIPDEMNSLTKQALGRRHAE
jgi:hypothetical protein